MEGFKEGKMGSLVIGISPFRSLYLMPQLCKKVRERFPGVKIVLHEYSSDRIRRDACEGKYDFAIANLPVDESILDAIPIEQDTLVWVVPKKYALNMPEGYLAKISISELKDVPFVVVSQNQEMRLLFDKICTAFDFKPDIAMEVIGLSTAWVMASAEVGATLLPLQFVHSADWKDSVNLYIPDCDTNIRTPAIIKCHGQYLSEFAEYAINLLTENIYKPKKTS